MNSDTDVLIVGGGPTGLMLACQLLRFGISFRIIDKQAQRTQESRAFAIQAKSMEIFQNLGIVSEFLKLAQSDPLIHFYINGKEKANFRLGKIPIADTPFPTVYFLPQSDTERILSEYLEKCGIKVERHTTLLSFTQTSSSVKAIIKDNITNKSEEINCQYIVGCDGAHSTVRHILKVPFEGSAYLQEFILADDVVNHSMASEFKVFFNKKGFFLYIPLAKDLIRIMGAKFTNSPRKEEPVTINEIESFAEQIAHKHIKISNITWMSRFYLHHRAVTQYQVERAFLAGDAAHIHSPVGGQGMNTGLQDATNLAWKIAFVLKQKSPKTLLATYQLERHRIGKILLKTTDQIFRLLASKNFVIVWLRQFLIPMLPFIIKHVLQIPTRLLKFISQLNIHYHENEFIKEVNINADAKFLAGPLAGCRAPDALISNHTLFELFKETPCNVLIFETANDHAVEENKLQHFNWLKIHKFQKTPETKILFDRYGITSAGNYFIRPDGYIGFRAYGTDLNPLITYLETLFKAPNNDYKS